jgi:DnaJ-class molecular chaperone
LTKPLESSRIFEGGDRMKTQTLRSADQKCLYCGGTGYYQLVLGGTDTCAHCNGTGKQPEQETED